ncbi:hypothetical protein MKQ68_13795 [Chitinophaga horti]|uniref:Uncharacterized protein n=1 Tax=Chitinophaga horti TaxID=2920382 RepID=A0ABY6IV47_9BACT|nr:hypothetical protein [Chitinophaga horti]UYQ91165.1 hypothetical protein MKQ68_13795 [Chitinophaga horti]
MTNRFDEIDERFNVIETEVKTLRNETNVRFNALEERLSTVETQVVLLRNDTNALGEKLTKVETQVGSLRTEMSGRFDVVDARLIHIESDLDKIEVWTGYRADHRLPEVRRKTETATA